MHQRRALIVGSIIGVFSISSVLSVRRQHGCRALIIGVSFGSSEAASGVICVWFSEASSFGGHGASAWYHRRHDSVDSRRSSMEGIILSSASAKYHKFCARVKDVCSSLMCPWLRQHQRGIPVVASVLTQGAHFFFRGSLCLQHQRDVMVFISI